MSTTPQPSPRPRLRFLSRRLGLYLLLVLLLIGTIGSVLIHDWWTLGVGADPGTTRLAFAEFHLGELVPCRDAVRAARALRDPNALATYRSKLSPGLLALLSDLTRRLDAEGWFDSLGDPTDAADRLGQLVETRTAQYLAVAKEFQGRLSRLAPAMPNGWEAQKTVLAAAYSQKYNQAGTEFRGFLDEAFRGGADLEDAVASALSAPLLHRDYLRPLVLALAGDLAAAHRDALPGERHDRLVAALAAGVEIVGFCEALHDRDADRVARQLGLKLRMRFPPFAEYGLTPADVRDLAGRLDGWHDALTGLMDWSENDLRVAVPGMDRPARVVPPPVDGDEEEARRYLLEVAVLVRWGKPGDQGLVRPGLPDSGPAGEKPPSLREVLGRRVVLPSTGLAFDAAAIDFGGDGLPEARLKDRTTASVVDQGRLREFLSLARLPDGGIFPWSALPLDRVEVGIDSGGLDLSWPELDGGLRVRVEGKTVRTGHLDRFRAYLRGQAAAVLKVEPRRVVLFDNGEFIGPAPPPGADPVHGRIDGGAVVVPVIAGLVEDGEPRKKLEARRTTLLGDLDKALGKLEEADLVPTRASRLGGPLARLESQARDGVLAKIEELARISASGTDFSVRIDKAGASIEPSSEARRVAAEVRERAAHAATAARATGSLLSAPVELDGPKWKSEWQAIRELAKDDGALKKLLDGHPSLKGDFPTRAKIVVHDGTRYLTTEAVPEKNVTGVLIAWRWDDSPLELEARPVVVAAGVHPEGEFLFPGRVLTGGGLTVTVEAIAAFEGGRRTFESLGHRRLEEKDAKDEEAYRLRLVREALKLAQVVSVRWGDGNEALNARFRRDGQQLRPLTLAAGGNAEAQASALLEGLGVSKLAAGRVGSLCVVSPVPVAINDLVEHKWVIPVLVAGTPPGEKVGTIEVPNTDHKVLFGYDRDAVEKLKKSGQDGLVAATGELKKLFPFLQLKDELTVVAPLLPGLDPVDLPLALLPEGAGSLPLRLAGKIQPAPQLMKVGLGWALDPIECQVALVQQYMGQDNLGQDKYRAHLLLHAAFKLPGDRRFEVVCELPEGTTTDRVKDILIAALKDAALPHLRDWLVGELAALGQPGILDVGVKGGAIGVTGTVTLGTPLGELPLDLEAFVRFKGGKPALEDLSGRVREEAVKGVFAKLAAVLELPAGGGPGAVTLEGNAVRIGFQGWKVGDTAVELRVEPGRVELTAETLKAILDRLEAVTKWREVLEKDLRSLLPTDARLGLKIERKDGFDLVVTLDGKEFERLPVRVSLDGIAGPHPGLIPPLLGKLAAKLSRDALLKEFKLTVLGLEAQAKKVGDSYEVVLKRGDDQIRLIGVRIEADPLKLDFSKAEPDAASKEKLQTYLNAQLAQLGLPESDEVAVTAVKSTSEDGGLGVKLSLLFTRRFFDRLGLGGELPDGLAVADALTVVHDGSRLRVKGNQDALEEAVSGRIEAAVISKCPVEIAGRKVFVKKFRLGAKKITLAVKVVEEGDFPIELTGQVTIPLDGRDPAWNLEIGSAMRDSLVAWLKKFLPNTPFFSIDQLDIDPNTAGKDPVIRFRFSSELYLMSLKSPLLTIHKGRVKIDDNSPIEFRSNLQIPLGSTPFVLVNPGGKLHLRTKDIAINGTVTVVGMTPPDLAGVFGQIETNLRRPTFLKLTGDLRALGLSLGSGEAKLDFEARNFTCHFEYGRRALASLDGGCVIQLPGAGSAWFFESESAVHVFDLDLQRIAVRADQTGFRATGKVDFLGEKAEASFESDLPLKDPRLRLLVKLNVGVGKYGVAAAEVGVVVSTGKTSVHVFARTRVAEVALDFDLPTWAALAPPLLAAKIVEAIAPKGIEFGHPLVNLWPPKEPKLRVDGGKIKVGGKGGKRRKGRKSDDQPSGGTPGGPGELIVANPVTPPPVAPPPVVTAMAAFIQAVSNGRERLPRLAADEREGLEKELEKQARDLVQLLQQKHRPPDANPEPTPPLPEPAAPVDQPMATSALVDPKLLDRGADAVKNTDLDKVVSGALGENTLTVCGAILKVLYAPDNIRLEAVRGFLDRGDGMELRELLANRLKAVKGDRIHVVDGTVYEHVLLLLALCEIRDAATAGGALSEPEAISKGFVEPIAAKLKFIGNRDVKTLTDVTDGMVRWLVQAQNEDGTWSYPGGQDMSVGQAALFGIRRGLESGDDRIGKDRIAPSTVRRVLGSNKANEDVEAFRLLGQVFHRARKYAESTREPSGRYRYQPIDRGSSGTIDFVGGALLAHAPLPIDLKELNEAERKALSDDEKALGADLGMAKAGEVADLALATRAGLLGRVTKRADGKPEAAFYFHYQALYTLRGLRAYAQAGQVQGSGDPRTADRVAEVGRFQAALYAEYLQLAEFGFLSPNNDMVKGAGAQRAMALMTLAYLARDLGWGR